MEARLQTAISSLSVYSMISVHRLDDLMVPRFYWLDLLLHASLKHMYGVPVSICDSRMWNQSFCALMVPRWRPSFSYFSYRALNSSEWQSARPGHSLGQKSDHSWFFWTRSMKRYGTQRP